MPHIHPVDHDHRRPGAAALTTLSVLALLAALLVAAPHASAAGQPTPRGTEPTTTSFVVNVEDGDYDTSCDELDELRPEADCSLRDAVVAANNTDVGEVAITFAPGVDLIALDLQDRSFDGVDPDFAGASVDDLDLVRSMSITDPEGVTIVAEEGLGCSETFPGDFAEERRVFQIGQGGGPKGSFQSSLAVRLAGLTLRCGSATEGGGILVSSGSLTLNEVTIESNDALDGGGLAVTDGFVSGSAVTMNGNEAFVGGAMDLFGSGFTSLVNSTISGNRAVDGTALNIAGESVLTMQYVTVVDNGAVPRPDLRQTDEQPTPASIVIESGQLYRVASIIATSESVDDCRIGQGLDSSGGYNDTSDGTCNPGPETDNPTATNRFGALALNTPSGGATPLTRTRALVAPSDAIDSIPTGPTAPGFAGERESLCETGEGAPSGTDQRGQDRPTNGGTALACDRGAFEYVPPAPNPNPNPNPNPQPEPEPETPVAEEPERLGGPTRLETAVLGSQTAFPDGGASAVVLARFDDFPDAQTGAPLAVELDAPLLLTQPSTLSRPTQDEILRVLPAPGTVYVIGGTEAVSDEVDRQVTDLGYDVVRVGGVNRFATAVAVAEQIGSPGTALLADGGTFTDTILAGAAAVVAGDSDFAQSSTPQVDAAVLLTSDDAMPAETQAYLDAVTPTVITIGDAAAQVLDGVEHVMGSTPAALSVATAERFFPTPVTVAFSTDADFPDALTGSATVGNPAVGPGPMLFTDPAELSEVLATYLAANRDTIIRTILFGGTDAVSADVSAQIAEALTG